MVGLTSKKIDGARPSEKKFKLSDGNGLFIEILPNGRKVFFIRIIVKGKEIRRNIGDYPTVTLAQARVQAIQIREALKASGGKSSKVNYHNSGELLEDWLNKKELEAQARGKTYSKEAQRVEKYIAPAFSDRNIEEITYQEILEMLKPIERAGKLEQMHRVKRLVLEFLGYAKANGHNLQFSIAEAREDLSHALVKRGKNTHYNTLLNLSDIAKFMTGIKCGARKMVSLALQFHAMTLVRPGELRNAEWSEIDFDKAVWTIPAEKMKMAKEHKVPLPRQAVAILQELKTLTGASRYIFPQARDLTQPLSDNTERTAIKKIIKRLGIPDMTPHGFRAMGSTILNEHGFSPDVIEAALAHSPETANAIRAAYNRYEYFNERKEMLQWYADFLENLKE